MRALDGMRSAFAILLVWGVLGASSGVATITADLSRHLIAITTAFTGTDVLLFGSIDAPGGDVLVTVQGPLGDETVRKKNRVGPIWLNTEQEVFDNVPFFYAFASNRPLEDIASEAVLRRHRIGLQTIAMLPPGAVEDADEARLEKFREGLIRNKQEARLYSTESGLIQFIGPQLFRSDLHFPANVQPGSYQVEVLHLRDGQVTGAQRSVLSISKLGIEAEIYDLAHEQAALYGIACIVIAITAGWTASAVFRRA